MPKWPSIFVVAIVAILLTLLGSSLAAGGGDSGGPQPLPCGITVENPCPPLLRVTAPTSQPKMTLTRGKYLVWLDGHGRMRQLNPGLYKLSGCLLYRDRGTGSEAVVLDPFRDASLIPTNDLESHSELYEAVEKLRKKHRPLFSSTPEATLPISLGEIHFRFPYQPVLVEVPAPAKGVQPPTVQPPAEPPTVQPPTAPSQPQQPSAVLSAMCKVRIPGTPRASDVESARIYALLLE
jgi:hypothetical protein